VDHREQLVTAIAEDGIELDGVIIRPSFDEQQLLVLWIHGFGANFYFTPTCAWPMRLPRVASRRQWSTLEA